MVANLPGEDMTNLICPLDDEDPLHGFESREDGASASSLLPSRVSEVSG